MIQLVQTAADNLFRTLAGPTRRALLALALAWAGCSLVREASARYRSMVAPPTSAPVVSWRLGSRPAERLRRCLEEARGLLPADAVVTFVSPPGPLNADFFRSRWAAYLLPDLDVVTPADGPTGSRFLIAFQMGADRPGLTLIRELPGLCGLYSLGTNRAGH